MNVPGPTEDPADDDGAAGFAARSAVSRASASSRWASSPGEAAGAGKPFTLYDAPSSSPAVAACEIFASHGLPDV